MTFAEALNQAECECGVEDGYNWFTDGEGEDASRVGDYSVGQTNSGPRVWHERDEVYGVEGFDKDGRRCVALYNVNNDFQWTDYDGEPKESDDDFEDDEDDFDEEE